MIAENIAASQTLDGRNPVDKTTNERRSVIVIVLTYRRRQTADRAIFRFTQVTSVIAIGLKNRIFLPELADPYWPPD